MVRKLLYRSMYIHDFFIAKKNAGGRSTCPSKDIKAAALAFRIFLLL